MRKKERAKKETATAKPKTSVFFENEGKTGCSVRLLRLIIEINPTKSMSSLTYFLYDIENAERLLVISDLNLTAPNMRNPTEVQGNLTVTGFARNNQPKGKAKEG